MNLCDSVIRTLAAFGIIVAMTGVTFADDILQYTGAGSAARALFPANDLLDWGQLGLPCESVNIPCVPSGTVATSNGGIGLTFSDAAGIGFVPADEGTSLWSGHFQLGDHVVIDGVNSGTVTFALNKLVAGIGFELAVGTGVTKPVTVQIFDDKGKVLSTLTQPVLGGACIPPCNTAPFYGFYDPEGRIASVVINPPENDLLAWNQVSLIDEPALSFAGTPGQANCSSQSAATLRGLYGSLSNAAAALGFTSEAALGNDIKEYCGE